jgi:hypothetical protein
LIVINCGVSPGLPEATPLRVAILSTRFQNMTIIGYARVSTADQDFSRQVEALKAAGAERIYSEKISGARTDRSQLAKLMASLQPGDAVMVTKIDRLGRSTRELLDLIHRISEASASFPSWATRVLHRVEPGQAAGDAAGGDRRVRARSDP